MLAVVSLAVVFWRIRGGRWRGGGWFCGSAGFLKGLFEQELDLGIHTAQIIFGPSAKRIEGFRLQSEQEGVSFGHFAKTLTFRKGIAQCARGAIPFQFLGFLEKRLAVVQSSGVDHGLSVPVAT